MTTMARCLEGHAFDTDASATCPICGSTVWRDAVKEAAEKAAREAKAAKMAKAAKAAREASERIDKAKGAKAARDAKAALEDAAARAAQADRDALEAQAAQRAAERAEEEERRKRAVNVVVPPGSPESGAAAHADTSSNGGIADMPMTNGVAGAAAKAHGAESKASLWVGLLVIFVGLPAALYGAYRLAASSQIAAVYQQYGENQPGNTTVENIVYTTLLDLTHSFQARSTDVPYGPNAGRVGHDGIVSVVPTGGPTATPTQGMPSSTIRDALTRSAPATRDTSPDTIPNPFAMPKH